MQRTKILNNRSSIKKFKAENPLYNKYSDDTMLQMAKQLTADIVDLLTLQPNGIFLKGFGYFAVSRVKFKGDKEVIENIYPHSDSNYYFIPENGYKMITYHPLLKNNKLNYYSFSAANKVHNKALTNNSVDYQNHYKLLRNLKINNEKLKVYKRRRNHR